MGRDGQPEIGLLSSNRDSARSSNRVNFSLFKLLLFVRKTKQNNLLQPGKVTVCTTAQAGCHRSPHVRGTCLRQGQRAHFAPHLS